MIAVMLMMELYRHKPVLEDKDRPQTGEVVCLVSPGCVGQPSYELHFYLESHVTTPGQLRAVKQLIPTLTPEWAEGTYKRYRFRFAQMRDLVKENRARRSQLLWEFTGLPMAGRVLHLLG